MNILIADDDLVCLKRLDYFFDSSVHRIFRATDGLEAWKIICNESLQLAILDWEMPGMYGVEICKSFRDQFELDFLYLVLLTSRNSRQDISKGIESGADDFLAKPVDAHELKVRLRAATRIIEFHERASKAAMQDSLTGVWNRKAIFDLIRKEHNRTEREHNTYSMILGDIDHFKKINDQFGHLTGDLVIRTVAARIQQALRTSDSVGRYGGEEFVILLPDCPEQEAAIIAERLRQSVSDTPIITEQGEISVSMSFGVSDNPIAFYSIELALKNADLALYASKSAGRNCATRYSHLQMPSFIAPVMSELQVN